MMQQEPLKIVCREENFKDTFLSYVFLMEQHKKMQGYEGHKVLWDMSLVKRFDVTLLSMLYFMFREQEKQGKDILLELPGKKLQNPRNAMLSIFECYAEEKRAFFKPQLTKRYEQVSYQKEISETKEPEEIKKSEEPNQKETSETKEQEDIKESDKNLAFKENIAIFTNINQTHVYDRELYNKLSISVPVDKNRIYTVTMNDLEEIKKEINQSADQKKVTIVESILSGFERNYKNMMINDEKYIDSEYGKLHMYELYTVLNEILVS